MFLDIDGCESPDMVLGTELGSSGSASSRSTWLSLSFFFFQNLDGLCVLILF